MPTITELVTEVRNMLDDQTIMESMLRQWLNEGNRDIARVTRHYKATDTVATVAGTHSYTLDAGVIAVEQAWYDDTSRQIPLTPRHIEQMDSIWGQQQDYEGAYPAYFMTIGYAPVTLRLYPVPSAVATIRLITAILPAAMPLTGSAETDVDVPPAWYDTLADYCTFKALQRDRDDRWQQFRQLYIEKRDDMLTLGDYDVVNREVIADPMSGYLPRWLVEPEGW